MIFVTAIDKDLLKKAMDLAGVTPKHLSEECAISLQYTCDILSGYRTLKRSPGLRKRIANALNVPVHWIENKEAA